MGLHWSFSPARRESGKCPDSDTWREERVLRPRNGVNPGIEDKRTCLSSTWTFYILLVELGF